MGIIGGQAVFEAIKDSNVSIEMTQLSVLVNNSLLHLRGHRFEIEIRNNRLLVGGGCMKRHDLISCCSSARDFFNYLDEFMSKNGL